MRHVTSAADEVTRTYRFWAQPIGTLPAEVWQIAHNQQRFWNELVRLREDVQLNYETLPEDAKEIRARFWSLLTGKQPEFRRWRTATKHAADLPWAIRDAILERFVISCYRAAAKKSGWPRRHEGLDRLRIFHRFTNGGRPVKKLFIDDKQLVWKFGIVAVPDDAYSGKSRSHTNRRLSSGFFGLSKTTKITFQTVLHRQLPLDAIVKVVAWQGILHPIRGWQWTIAIILKETSKRVTREPGPACGIDLGWRARRDYVRIGILRDSRGSIVELRLPLSAQTSKTRRHSAPSSYYDLRKIDRAIDDHINSVKVQI
jgi:hypothetical protein